MVVVVPMEPPADGYLLMLIKMGPGQQQKMESGIILDQLPLWTTLPYQKKMPPPTFLVLTQFRLLHDDNRRQIESESERERERDL